MLFLQTPAAAINIQQFDLRCVGTLTTGNTLPARGNGHYWTGEFQIDLGAMRWCVRRCLQSKPIKDVGELVELELLTGAVDMPSSVSLLVFDPSKHAIKWRYDTRRGSAYEIDAKCEPAPFTPLPQG